MVPLGPSLTLKTWFHPQFECMHNKVSKIEYCFMKLVGVQKICRIQFWQGFLFNDENEHQHSSLRQRTGKGKSKTGGETPLTANLGENTSLVPSPMYCFRRDFVPSFAEAGSKNPQIICFWKCFWPLAVIF